MDEEVKLSIWQQITRFLRECRRVLRVTRKPSQTEFKAIVKVSALGMLIIGAIGFVIHMLVQII